MQVACHDTNYPLNAMRIQPHRQLLENMTHSIFCLIIPGNSQSSQRLTEAFLTGCIPVFVGPPWHSLPLTQMARPPGLDFCCHKTGLCQGLAYNSFPRA